MKTVAEFKEFERRISNVSRFKPALDLNRVLADLNRGSNSLNSISDKCFTGSVGIRNHDQILCTILATLKTSKI